MRDFKIPQAVAMILLASALTAAEAQNAKPNSGKGSTTPVRAQVEITQLLHEFLKNVDDPAMHDRFWADDLIYTASSGTLKTKAEILKGMRESPPPKPVDPKTTYDAQDIVVRQFGDVAVLNFRLVMHTGEKGKPETHYFLNSGTFVKREGRWQVVVWQATKAAEPAKSDEKKPEEKK